MTNQDATEILAEHLVRTALRMLNHGTCPIKDPEELRQVGGDALLSASMMFLHTYCEFEDREIASIFRSCADQLESLGASQRGGEP